MWWTLSFLCISAMKRDCTVRLGQIQVNLLGQSFLHDWGHNIYQKRKSFFLMFYTYVHSHAYMCYSSFALSEGFSCMKEVNAIAFASRENVAVPCCCSSTWSVWAALCWRITESYHVACLRRCNEPTTPNLNLSTSHRTQQKGSAELSQETTGDLERLGLGWTTHIPGSLSQSVFSSFWSSGTLLADSPPEAWP